MKKKLLRFWKALGPGIITGAADNDPSGITTYSIAGARFGTAPLWILLYILPFMIAIQNMCARIGALSGCGLAGNIRRHYPAGLLAIVAVALVAANIFNVGADIYGMAGALNLIIPLDIRLLGTLMAIAIMALVITLRYRHIESIFRWFAISLFVYGIALFLVNPDWMTIARSLLIPVWTNGDAFFLTLFAMMGTTISPYLFFWQASQEAEDVRQDRPTLRVCKFRTVRPGILHQIELDTRLGMIASNLVSFFIVSLTASTIFTAGSDDITTLRDAALALKPLAGEYAFILFALGVVGSGLLAIPVLAGSAAYVVAEFMGWSASLDKPFNRARQFYLVMVGAVAVGMLMPFLGMTPVQALYWAAIINGMIAPPLIMLIIHMANNPDIVGPHRSSAPVHYLGVIAMMLMLTGTLFVVFS
ncbi:MAG: divalent metal cation transporter [Candidatus Yanofskybacteria bacterium]|nr:divalent metal cation transporter [Candidatus Yanofskybacteria bacterium]